MKNIVRMFALIASTFTRRNLLIARWFQTSVLEGEVIRISAVTVVLVVLLLWSQINVSAQENTNREGVPVTSPSPQERQLSPPRNQSGDVQVAWIVHYVGPNRDDEASALAVDNMRNVYVTGKSNGGGTFGYDYATLKYDAGGVLQWAARYDGPGSDEPTAVAVVLHQYSIRCKMPPWIMS